MYYKTMKATVKQSTLTQHFLLVMWRKFGPRTVCGVFLVSEFSGSFFTLRCLFPAKLQQLEVIHEKNNQKPSSWLVVQPLCGFWLTSSESEHHSLLAQPPSQRGALVTHQNGNHFVFRRQSLKKK